MRNKKLFSFDEEKDAESIIENGFEGGVIDYNKMYLLAKYLRQKFGYGKIRLERELIKFCKTQDKNFNPVVEAESVKKWVKSALEYRLRKVNSVSITQKEINFLKNIKVEKDRKILFAILILSKALKNSSTRINNKSARKSNNYYIRYSNFQDIIKLSNTANFTEINLAQVIYKYREYFTPYSPEKELLRVNYVDPDSESGIVIDNLDNIMKYYDLFFSRAKEMKICPLCQREFIKTNNSQKRCKECSRKVNNEKHKLIMRKRRLKTN